MAFTPSHGKINLNVKTYGSNSNNNSIDVFKNTIYQDAVDFNISSYDSEIDYGTTFSAYDNTFNFDEMYAAAASRVSVNEVMSENYYLYKHSFIETGKLFVRAGATAVMLCISLLEGVVWFLETVGDGIVICLGIIATPTLLFLDVPVALVSFLLTGEAFSLTRAMWMDQIMTFVSKDHTGDAFSSVLKDSRLDELSYAKYGGTMYNIGKNVGYQATMAVATSLTGGLVGLKIGASVGKTALLSNASGFLGKVTIKTTIKAAWVAFANFSKNVSKNWNKMVESSDGNELTSFDVLKNLFKSGGQATIDGLFTWLGSGYGDAGKGTTSIFNGFWNNKYVKREIGILIKASKSIFSEGFNSICDLLDGKGWSYDTGAVRDDMVATFIVENILEAGWFKTNKENIAESGANKVDNFISSVNKWFGSFFKNSSPTEVTNRAGDLFEAQEKGGVTLSQILPLLSEANRAGVQKAGEKVIETVVNPVEDLIGIVQSSKSMDDLIDKLQFSIKSDAFSASVGNVISGVINYV